MLATHQHQPVLCIEDSPLVHPSIVLIRDSGALKEVLEWRAWAQRPDTEQMSRVHSIRHSITTWAPAVRNIRLQAAVALAVLDSEELVPRPAAIDLEVPDQHLAATITQLATILDKKIHHHHQLAKMLKVIIKSEWPNQ